MEQNEMKLSHGKDSWVKDISSAFPKPKTSTLVQFLSPFYPQKLSAEPRVETES